MSNDNPHDGGESESNDEPTIGVTSDRREYLKLAGTTAISVVGVSTAADGVAGAETGGVEFERTVNMVEDAGCDPTAGSPCNGSIMEYAADDTLLKFPEGTYLLDTDGDTHVTLEGCDSLGLAGENENVIFEFTSGTDGYDDISVADIGQFVYRDIDWDVTAENCAPGFSVRARDRLSIQNWEIIGRQDNDGGFALQPGIASPDGIGVIKNFVATEGSKFETAPRGGVLVSRGRNNGTLRFVDCRLEEFENNGLYAAASGGPIQVVGGVFRNNMRSQLRFSGEDSYVEDALIEVDVSAIAEEAEPEAFKNGRGIWWETKNTDPLHTGGEIRDTEVIIRNAGESTVPNTTGGIVVRPDGGACTIRDTRIQMDVTPRVAVYAKAPVGNPDTGKPVPPEPNRIVMDNVTVTGSASDWTAVQIEERPESVIKNCTLDVGYRDGITLAECDGSSVRDTVINSKYGGGRPLVLWGTEAEISNVDTNNADPIPDGDDDDEEDEDDDE